MKNKSINSVLWRVFGTFAAKTSFSESCPFKVAKKKKAMKKKKLKEEQQAKQEEEVMDVRKGRWPLQQFFFFKSKTTILQSVL